MNFYSMERMEMIGDAMTEIAEQMAFEADMATNPYGDTAPTNEDMERMAEEADREDYLVNLVAYMEKHYC